VPSASMRKSEAASFMRSQIYIYANQHDKSDPPAPGKAVTRRTERGPGDDGAAGCGAKCL
jgi:hypothetical protein